MRYVKAIKTSDLKSGQKMEVTIEGKDILLINIDNKFYATDSKCTHMGGELNKGRLEGSHIICPKHGSVFDVKTGKLIEQGKMFSIRVKAKDLNSYPVMLEGGDVFIGI
ncbi:MAG: Rieske 2Fe-2S domain-containing protein [Eubacteriaceae bacterium]|nr:Rieske 2Fe-2S domain-containing protein [Eubacteriaceae bacterium]